MKPAFYISRSTYLHISSKKFQQLLHSIIDNKIFTLFPEKQLFLAFIPHDRTATLNKTTTKSLTRLSLSLDNALNTASKVRTLKYIPIQIELFRNTRMKKRKPQKFTGKYMRLGLFQQHCRPRTKKDVVTGIFL